METSRKDGLLLPFPGSPFRAQGGIYALSSLLTHQNGIKRNTPVVLTSLPGDTLSIAWFPTQPAPEHQETRMHSNEQETHSAAWSSSLDGCWSARSQTSLSKAARRNFREKKLCVFTLLTGWLGMLHSPTSNKTHLTQTDSTYRSHVLETTCRQGSMRFPIERHDERLGLHSFLRAFLTHSPENISRSCLWGERKANHKPSNHNTKSLY